MSQPESYTAAQAADPTTPGQVLADIAALRPDLRPAVASNPSAYPGLLEWLKSLGEPAVDAALATRPAAPTQQLPAPAPQRPAPTQQMPATPPAPSWAGQSTTPTAMPGSAPAGAPSGAPYAAAPPQGYGPTPPQGYSAAPQQGYGAMPPQGYAGTPPKKSNKALWIILTIVGLVILLVGIGIFVFFRFINKVAEELDPSEAMAYGDNAMLDGLYDRCADEDWGACDDLYRLAAADSEYFEFGDTCGGAWEAGTSTYCVDAMAPDDEAAGEDTGDQTGEDTGEDVGEDTGEETDATLTATEELYYGALQTACSAQDWQSCDALYWATPSGSAYEEFGATCGGQSEASGGMCDTQFGDGVEEDRGALGTDPGLDAVADACEAGDAEACDFLYWESPGGSEYETFAEERM